MAPRSSPLRHAVRTRYSKASLVTGDACDARTASQAAATSPWGKERWRFWRESWRRSAAVIAPLAGSSVRWPWAMAQRMMAEMRWRTRWAAAAIPNGLMRPQSCGAGGNRTPVRREVAASDTTIPGYCFAGGTPPGRLPVRAPPDLSPVSMVFPTVSGLSQLSSPASVARLQRTGPACPRGGRSYLTDQSGDQAARSTGSSLPCHWCPVFGV